MNPEYYLKKLQKYPHRGVGTKYEREAFKMILDEHKKLGYTPKVHYFKTIRNTWVVELLRHIFFIPSAIFVLLGNFWPAFAFMSIGIFVNVTQSSITAEIIKKIFPITSQNVFSQLLPKNKIKQTVVVLGHVDTARRTVGLDLIAGFFGKNMKVTKDIDKKFPNFFRGPYFLTNLAIVSNFFALVFVYLPVIPVVLSALTLIIIIPTSFLMLHTMFSPFVPGAFDNGSGASGVLTVAQHFSKNNNLKHTRVIFLNNGSEESLTHGFRQFLKEADINKENTYFINFEGIGSDQPLVAYGETGPLGNSCFYEKNLYKKVTETIKRDKRFQAFEQYYLAVPTDCCELSKLDCKIITTISSLENDGYYSHYHKLTDTIEKINFDNIALSCKLCIKIIENIDNDI